MLMLGQHRGMLPRAWEHEHTLVLGRAYAHAPESIGVCSREHRGMLPRAYAVGRGSICCREHMRMLSGG